MELKNFFVEAIRDLNIPKGKILYLHVRLKGIPGLQNYRESSLMLLDSLNELCNPKTILVPTFTYSFTKKGIYHRSETASEVGRFGEEVRKTTHFKKRTLNPVFSVIDVNNYFKHDAIECSAFGSDSLFHKLHKEGHVIININLSNLIITYFHYVEYIKNVDYRYIKVFRGKVYDGFGNEKSVEYKYHVRKLELDTNRRYSKIEKYLSDLGVLHTKDIHNVKMRWIYSRDLFDAIGRKLDQNQRYMITD